MTEKEFKHKYMGICVSDQEIIEYLEKENKQLKKQEEILLDRILTLQKTNGSLTDKVEKMKCCGNCEYCLKTEEYCKIVEGYVDCDSKCNKWELAE